MPNQTLREDLQIPMSEPVKFCPRNIIPACLVLGFAIMAQKIKARISALLNLADRHEGTRARVFGRLGTEQPG